MIIRVPAVVRQRFWDEPPSGVMEFWGFRYRPVCQLGETIYFLFDLQRVATAIVAKIEEPGQSVCGHSGKFGQSWKVFWEQSSFIDLRGHGHPELPMAKVEWPTPCNPHDWSGPLVDVGGGVFRPSCARGCGAVHEGVR